MPAVPGFVFCFCATAVLAPESSAQILSTYNDSLTTYLAGATKVQGVQPQYRMRGVGIDGSTRQGPVLSMALAGNPFENAWTGREHQGPLRLDVGAWSPTEVDIALPSTGLASWVVARTYSAVQKSGGSAVDSDGPMGRNWAMSGSPEIVFYSDGDNAKDVLYLVYGADRYVEFVRYNSSSNQFRGRNGSAGVFDHVSGSPDTWVYTDQVGTRFTFFGFNTTSNIHDGQLWKIVDTANNMAFVGHATTSTSAISSGFDGSGRVTTAYDSSDRRYTYTYTSTSYGGKTRLESVIVETKTSGSWSSPSGVAEVYRVEYSYYGNESHGDGGDLKLVKTTTPLTDSGVSLVKKKLYRYWEGSSDNTSAYHATTNPGYVHALKYIYESEGLRRYDWTGDSTLDEDFLSASDDTLKPYAAAYFEYNSSRQVSKAWFGGQCGCSGAGDGTYEYTYEDFSTSLYTVYKDTNEWRTIVKRPDGSYLTQYFDNVGQGMSPVITDIVPSSGSAKQWTTVVERNSSTGQVLKVFTPENVTAYTHGASMPALSVTKASGDGLIQEFDRVSSGDLTGFIKERSQRTGTSGTLYRDASFTYTSSSKTIGDTAVVRPLLASSRVYPVAVSDPSTTGSSVTTYAYTNYSADTGVENMNQALVPEVVTATLPEVTSGNNGSDDDGITSTSHHLKDGRADYEKGPTGIVTHKAYTNGQMTTLREDADTDSLVEPTGFTNSGTKLDRYTESAFDPQGRLLSQTLHKEETVERKPYTYRSRLADHRIVTLDFPNTVTSGSTTYYGPVRFSIANHAGKVEASGVLALSSSGTTSASTGWVDESDADPLTALDLAAVGQLSTSIYDESGAELEESRAYFSIPSSGAGTDGTHYDPTKYGYDSMGRQWRTKEASGTIRRTVFDLIGRKSESWIGTNDSNFSGGESSGTDNMVKTEIVEYDGGPTADKGNSLLTKRTLRVESTSTGERVTNYTYDSHGRLLLEENPTAPHAFHKYDNMGRRVATGLFSSIGSITAASDDPTTETTNRLALSQTFYDERGRVWKTQRHKIDDADGSDDDNLQTLTWYDEAGRVIKVDGSSLTKTRYDGLGRATIEYTLAKDDDSAYGDVDDVGGDIVQEEVHTGHDGSKNDVVLQVSVGRWHNDATHGSITETTGELDENVDPLVVPAASSSDSGSTELLGRAQISASWYDSLGRVTDRVEYGTYNGSSFSRSGLSVPSRSDTALRTSYVYNDDGTLKSVEDPKALKTYFTYDTLGRRLSEVKNWDGTGSPSPTSTDDNVTVKYEYVDGLRTKLIADLPSGPSDQTTTYIYGTVAGTPSASKLATGHLLRAVIYPDSSNAGDDHLDINSDSSDVVSHAYNVQGQELYKKDQGGGVIEMEFDTSGRQTHKRITTLGSGIDGAVRRITTAYDSLGRTATVTQYDNAAVGSGAVVDEVKYTYDDWGNVEKFEQDKNSAVGASGSVDDYEVSYTYETKTSPGRNTIRKTTKTLPSGKVITYAYLNREGQYDNASSRLTAIKDGAVYLAEYMYNGVGQVVRTEYLEPEVMWDMTDVSTTLGPYPDLDRFNRVVKSKWTKDLSTDVDFYNVALTYDRNSNISSADDSVHAGFDVLYSMDDTSRLVRAEEGTLGGGSISSRTRDQQWTLTHTGNWDRDKVDLNGDGDFVDTDEVDDTRTHNAVNELTSRDTDSNSSADYTLAYDAAGNMTDDGKDFEYEYDALYRLRKVRKTSNQALAAEYRYNGLGYKIAVHEDTDVDGDVDGSDKWYYDAFDERWRQVARFRESDSAPKQEFVHHQAGSDGRGGSSYIDLVVCRYKDANSDWVDDPSDGTLEERLFYCQSWRADVSAIVSTDGSLREWVKYSAYGVPFGMPGGDTDSDGDCDSTDVTQVQAWIDAPAYSVRADIDLDRDVDSTDKSTIQGTYQGLTCGLRKHSTSTIDNDRTFAGTTNRLWMSTLTDVRNRTSSAELGRWTERDPLAYVDGNNVYQSAKSNPLCYLDPSGEASQTAQGGFGFNRPTAEELFRNCIPPIQLPTCPEGQHYDQDCLKRCKRGFDYSAQQVLDKLQFKWDQCDIEGQHRLDQCNAQYLDCVNWVLLGLASQAHPLVLDIQDIQRSMGFPPSLMNCMDTRDRCHRRVFTSGDTCEYNATGWACGQLRAEQGRYYWCSRGCCVY